MVETSFNEDYFRAVLLCDTLDTDPFSVPSCMPLPQQGEANTAVATHRGNFVQ